jgi:H2-forming N5,N10-methylenetetrahydromethanopterin dehydrogenase-like enzyme
MVDERLVLQFHGLRRPEAQELAESVGAEAAILPDDLGPVGGYGDLGRRTVAVIVTARALRGIARYLAARQHSRADTVSLAVEIVDPDGTRHEETVAYEVAPGQSPVEAAQAALRALPGVSEALEQSLW